MDLVTSFQVRATWLFEVYYLVETKLFLAEQLVFIPYPSAAVNNHCDVESLSTCSQILDHPATSPAMKCTRNPLYFPL